MKTCLAICVVTVSVVFFSSAELLCQTPDDSFAPMLTRKLSGDPGSPEGYVRYVGCSTYRLANIGECFPILCNGVADVIWAIKGGAVAWNDKCFQWSEDSASENTLVWDCVNSGSCYAASTPDHTLEGDVRSFQIAIYRYNKDGAVNYTCDGTCGTNASVLSVTAHEFGHVMGLSVGYQNLSDESIMNEGSCYGGIRFIDRCARDYLYRCALEGWNGSWGSLKGIFSNDCAAAYGVAANRSIRAGGLEPRSSRFPRIAWSDFAPSDLPYTVLRRVDESETFEAIRTTAHGDTVLVDTTAVPGHTYHYRVASEQSDTLRHTEEMSYGLQLVSELFFYDIQGDPHYLHLVKGDTVEAQWWTVGASMIPHGQTLYLAAKDKLKKINVADPLNPIVLGTRDLSSLPPYRGVQQEVRDMAIGIFNSHLFAVTNSSLIAFNASDNALPIESIMDGFFPDFYECRAIAVIDKMAYVATSKGILAIWVSSPVSPQMWGSYAGTGTTAGEGAVALEAVNGYLYAEFGTGQGRLANCHTEILKPQVHETEHTVYFDVICTDHDDPICFAGATDLVATDRTYMLRGNPAGYYALGRTDSLFTVLNTTDPANPTVIKRIEAPWSKRRGDWFYYHPDSYAFDDQYLYCALYRGAGNPWSAVYAFDLCTPDTGAVYAIGDMEIGQYKRGSLASRGRYLYYFDKVSDAHDYHRLQIFEKARACDPNLQVAIGPDPIATAYEVDQDVRISWTCSGCPTRIDVKLVEDGIRATTIASLKKFEHPDLAASSILWPAQGISANPNSHSYCLEILAWNIEGSSAQCYSNSFQIVDDIQGGEKEPTPVVEGSIDGGKKQSYPLPGFAPAAGEQENSDFLILPDNIDVVAGEIALDVRTGEDLRVSVSTMTLLAVDAPDDYQVIPGDGGPALQNGNGETFRLLPLLTVAAGGISERATQPAVGISAVIAANEPINIPPGGSHRFVFRVPEKASAGTRHYVLRYGGLLMQSAANDDPIPRAFALKDPYPNPFNPSTVLGFDVPREAGIHLAVYDVVGRLIRVLKHGRCKPGAYRVTWNGCDSRGRSVASGMYFCRLIVDSSERFTTKLILVR